MTTLQETTAALVQNVESLLQAVNTRKLDLDAAETAASTSAATAADQAAAATTQANIATSKAALLGSVATLTASATVNLPAGSAVYQFIDPAGAARDVVLADLTDAGSSYAIKNTGTLGNALTLKNAAGTQIGPLVANGYSVAVVWTGTTWVAL